MPSEPDVRARYDDLLVDDPTLLPIIARLDAAHRSIMPPVSLEESIRSQAARAARLPEGQGVPGHRVRARAGRGADHPGVDARWRTTRALGLGALAVAIVVVLAFGWTTLAPRWAGPGQVPFSRPTMEFDGGPARFSADSMRIATVDQVFTGAGLTDPSSRAIIQDARHLRFALGWREAGGEPGLEFDLVSDGGTWWASVIRATGDPRAEWVSWPGRYLETPVDRAWVGDLDLTGQDATGGAMSLELRGATLTAFQSGSIPPTLLGCRNVVDPSTRVAPTSDTDPLDPGQPLAGSGIERMAPADAARRLQADGLCHLFTYIYDYTSDAPAGAIGYGETWCAPPEGIIESIGYDALGAIRLFVVDAVPMLHTPRPQPSVGWGC